MKKKKKKQKQTRIRQLLKMNRPEDIVTENEQTSNSY